MVAKIYKLQNFNGLNSPLATDPIHLLLPEREILATKVYILEISGGLKLKLGAFGHRATGHFQHCVVEITHQEDFISYFITLFPVFPFQNNPKTLDPSYKMDLEFWDCFGRESIMDLDF